MERSESIVELAQDLIKAQFEIKNPEPQKTNPFFSSKYVPLSFVIESTKLILANHNLTIIQMPTIMDNLVTVETMLLHTSGQFLMCQVKMPVQKKDSQGVMSATTYARRSGWQAMCGISQHQEDEDGVSDEDDDGNESSGGDFTMDGIQNAISNQDLEMFNKVWVDLSKHEQRHYYAQLTDNQQEIVKGFAEGKTDE